MSIDVDTANRRTTRQKCRQTVHTEFVDFQNCNSQIHIFILISIDLSSNAIWSIHNHKWRWNCFHSVFKPHTHTHWIVWCGSCQSKTVVWFTIVVSRICLQFDHIDELCTYAVFLISICSNCVCCLIEGNCVYVCDCVFHFNDSPNCFCFGFLFFCFFLYYSSSYIVKQIGIVYRWLANGQYSIIVYSI